MTKAGFAAIAATMVALGAAPALAQDAPALEAQRLALEARKIDLEARRLDIEAQRLQLALREAEHGRGMRGEHRGRGEHAMRGANDHRGDDRGDGPDRAGRLDGMFAAMDADADGRITRDEAQAHRRFGLDPAAGPVNAAAFEAAVTAQMARMAAARAQALFADLDANKDGALDAAELQARDAGPHARMFDRLDADDDGVVTRAEAEAARGRHGRHRG